MRPVIHSQKHYVQFSRSTVTTVTAETEDLVLGVEGTTANAVDEVIEGALVKAIYIELWVIDAGAGGSIVVTLTKTPASLGGPTFTQSNGLGIYANKKNILFTHQGLTPNDGIAEPRLVMRGWYKIPKSKQRIGLGDGVRLVIANNGPQDLFYCGFATYKEYT